MWPVHPWCKKLAKDFTQVLCGWKSRAEVAQCHHVTQTWEI